MTYKEMNAVVMLAVQALVLVWLVATRPPSGSLQDMAIAMVWAIGLMVAFNVAAIILITIAVSIVRRAEYKDEAADERERAIAARSMRNAYLVASIGAAGSLVLLAMGHEAATSAYVLFWSLMGAGAVDSLSRLYYYRTE